MGKLTVVYFDGAQVAVGGSAVIDALVEHSVSVVA